MREMLRLNLELVGHEVVQAGDGLHALRLVAGGLRPDLVIMDVMMPELDGWETLSRLKADPAVEVADVPVIMLTALSADMDRIRGGIEGAVRYVTKPFAVSALVEAVDDALAVDEPEERRWAQRTALGQLARLEKGEEIGSGSAEHIEHGGTGRVRFSRLERQPSGPAPAASAPVHPGLEISLLSTKQAELLAAVGRHETVSDAAGDLGVSRSNVYASLRRIARRLDVASVPELLLMARRSGPEG